MQPRDADAHTDEGGRGDRAAYIVTTVLTLCLVRLSSCVLECVLAAELPTVLTTSPPNNCGLVRLVMTLGPPASVEAKLGSQRHSWSVLATPPMINLRYRIAECNTICDNNVLDTVWLGDA